MFKIALAVVLFASAGALAQLSCERYCALMVDANCTGNANSVRGQYTDEANCLAVCAAAEWTNGTDADTTGNTLGCRIYHAGAANTTGNQVHCGHAGFTGAGTCGTYFENYCHYQKGCGFAAPADGCAAVAALYPTGSPLTYTSNSADNTNTHACRFYHMSVAYSNAATPATFALHCGHGALASKGDTCGTAIEGYCTAVGTCTGAESGFTGALLNCTQVTTAQQVAEGALSDVAADSLQCRTYHAVVANSAPIATNKPLHCPHAGPSGGGACATACDDYCRLYSDVCGTINSTQYTNNAACMTACGAFPAGVFSDVGGDTAFCRIYHVNVASLSPALAQVHCFHAQQNPTAACVTTTGSTGSTGQVNPTTGQVTTTGSTTGTPVKRAVVCGECGACPNTTSEVTYGTCGPIINFDPANSGGCGSVATALSFGQVYAIFKDSGNASYVNVEVYLASPTCAGTPVATIAAPCGVCFPLQGEVPGTGIVVGFGNVTISCDSTVCGASTTGSTGAGSTGGSDNKDSGIEKLMASPILAIVLLVLAMFF